MENNLVEGLLASLNFYNLLWVILGVGIGVIIGILPGLGPMTGLAILMPITYYLDVVPALIFSAGIYTGSVYGGSVTAILVNIPGAPTSAATILDGFPLAQKGRALEALAASTTASFVGGLAGVIMLIFFTPLFSKLLYYFASPEFFMLGVLGLIVIAFASNGSLVKGLMTGGFGLLISSIGFDSMSGVRRFDFGFTFLADGISLVALVVGLLGLSQAFIIANEGRTISRETELLGSLMDGVKAVFTHFRVTVQSTLIGAFIGAVPGVGGATSNFIAYMAARQASKSPDTFGKGNIEGVIAAEASNNATVGTTLIPTLVFGIPGGGTSALFLGILAIHGLYPGTELFTTNANITYTFFGGFLMAQLAFPLICFPLLRYLAKVTTFSYVIMVPAIIVLSVIGAFSFRNSMFDVFMSLVFGIVGYFMRKANYPVICLLLGFVLGPIVEKNFLRALLAYGNYSFLITRPITVLLIIIIVSLILVPYVRRKFSRTNTTKAI